MKWTMARALFLGAVTLVLAVLAQGCCDTCSELAVDLSLPDSRIPQTVQVEFQQVGGTAAPISCTWGIAFGSEYGWTCTRDKDGSTTQYSTGYFAYNLSDPNKSWTIQLMGPTGTQTFTRTPKGTSNEKSILMGCSCTSYALFVTPDDMEGVGVVMPGVSVPIDAGVDGM